MWDDSIWFVWLICTDISTWCEKKVHSHLLLVVCQTGKTQPHLHQQQTLESERKRHTSIISRRDETFHTVSVHKLNRTTCKWYSHWYGMQTGSQSRCPVGWGGIAGKRHHQHPAVSGTGLDHQAPLLHVLLDAQLYHTHKKKKKLN